MRARDKARLATLRLITSEFKRVEVDERVELDDARVLAILDKMRKQRADAEDQYRQAGRTELADQEAYETSVIEAFLPQPLSDRELDALVREAIEGTGASGPKDMGAVMGWLKPRVQGRADMGAVSGRVKKALS